MTIAQRLAKLEKQNRWMKRVGGVVLAAVACVVLIGQGKAKELPDLVAKSLTIKDAKGKTRAELRIANQGAAFLGLFDEAGVARASLLTLSNGAPMLNFRDKAGQTMALLTTVRGGACSLYLTEANVLRAKLGVGSLALHDAKGNVVWKAPPK